jgi:hypothetical protein
VITQNGPSLETCFRQAQATTPEWSARVDASFTRDGGRGGKVTVMRNGQEDRSGQAEQVKDCIYGRYPFWPWPPLPAGDGGRQHIVMTARWSR